MSMIGVVSIAGKGYLTASVVTYLFSGFIEVTLVLSYPSSTYSLRPEANSRWRRCGDASAHDRITTKPSYGNTNLLIQGRYRLAFIGTLVYASVIYHRHRHNIPYHRSAQAASSTDNDRYKGPFTDPEIGVARYNNNQPGNRDSASAPEVGTTTMQERWVGELGNESEIREMDTPDEKNVGKRDRGHHRELDGDSWIYELSATGSVRGSHRGQMGELDGATPPKVPEKS
ncbi:MAG: hypothetical protein LQ338_002774 [Usnochroma carphineum]|nr:MAG: hypothetical protein LQ338_002774 [Usnochroma carphineum]